MNIFNDFLALLLKVAVVCLVIGLCVGFWLARHSMAGTVSIAAAYTVRQQPHPARPPGG